MTPTPAAKSSRVCPHNTYRNKKNTNKRFVVVSRALFNQNEPIPTQTHSSFHFYQVKLNSYTPKCTALFVCVLCVS